jgi:hypothetical protein
MAIKYTRPDMDGDPTPRQTPRFSAAPPSRRSLNFVIAGTVLVVLLLAMLSNLQATSSSNAPASEWLDAVVEFNDVTDGQRVLRVVVENNDGEPSVYDVDVDLSTKWLNVRAGDTVRLQVAREIDGTIARILAVEPGTEPNRSTTPE